MCNDNNHNTSTHITGGSENTSENQAELRNFVFADNMRFLRRKYGLTQKDMAKKLGLALASIQRYEL